MPSITTAGQVTLINLGPLTTAYSAPPSCSTNLDHPFIARTVPGGEPPLQLQFSPDCTGAPQGDCFPSAAKVDSAAAALLTNPAKPFAHYFSPGVACPTGWSTVGVVVKKQDGGFSSTGAFSSTAAPPDVLIDPSVNVVMNAIDPGETAVACCPSGWTVDLGGVCFSKLPASAYRPTKGCFRPLSPGDIITKADTSYVFLGHTVTGTVQVVTATRFAAPTTTTFGAAETAELVGVTLMPIAMLIHRENDLANGGGPATTTKPNLGARLSSSGLLRIWGLALALPVLAAALDLSLS